MLLPISNNNQFCYPEKGEYMHYTFIMEGQQVNLDAEYIYYSAKHQDITPVGAEWKEIIHAGDNKIELKGRTVEGIEIYGVFRILSVSENNIPIIERWSDHPVVGGGQ